jgi:diphosphomevalonate decarboxylase
MMCSDPSYMLMEEGSLAIIKKVKAFRADTNIPLYFTLDAGPNVHLLYPHENELDVRSFITSELKPLCHEGKIIYDHVGQGAQKIM